ncbi:hypothetical protein EYF80_048318 [Liparis tanakae]|uniref:Uncharacterized protein n=1 Tax=Liparis tanakae TaxID=230148 RepID=A0A4Z2FMJ0_9TELE|nr:hypothetical protein EYF80_048318 [Liparis tanakae]
MEEGEQRAAFSRLGSNLPAVVFAGPHAGGCPHIDMNGHLNDKTTSSVLFSNLSVFSHGGRPLCASQLTLCSEPGHEAGLNGMKPVSRVETLSHPSTAEPNHAPATTGVRMPLLMGPGVGHPANTHFISAFIIHLPVHQTLMAPGWSLHRSIVHFLLSKRLVLRRRQLKSY